MSKGHSTESLREVEADIELAPFRRILRTVSAEPARDATHHIQNRPDLETLPRCRDLRWARMSEFEIQKVTAAMAWTTGGLELDSL